MINENAAIYIGIVTACILETVPEATVVVRRYSKPESYEVIGTGRAKTGESVQCAHCFSVVEVAVAPSSHLVNAARLAGDSVGLQLRDRTV